MKVPPHLSRRRTPEQGYVLIVILLMLAILVIAVTAIAPREATQIRRDREAEAIHRGQEYAKAVKRFYRKFGRYPTRIEELESTNNMRFLRRRYKDPISGEDFVLLHYGQQKTLPRGLFGAPPGAGAVPGALPIGAPVGGAGGGQPPGQAPGTPAAGMGSGPTFGGGPIIGVKGVKDQTSLKEWNGKTNYKDWEFYYDPRFDTQGAQGLAPGGQGGIPQPVRSPLNPQPQPPRPQTPR